MTFSELIEVLQELTRPLPDSIELPLTMALKNQVCWVRVMPSAKILGGEGYAVGGGNLSQVQARKLAWRAGLQDTFRDLALLAW